MATITRTYDASRYLDNNETVAAFLADAFEEDDPASVAHALGVVARARGMTQLAKETGLAREALYRALSKDGNPSYATVSKVARALGVRLTIEPNIECHNRSASSRPGARPRRAARSAALPRTAGKGRAGPA